MKKGLTELVFILDKSGSMCGLEADTVGGFNSMLKKQKEVEGECLITTVLFNNYFELLHDRVDIKAVSPITEREYQVGGPTALLDAIGFAIQKVKNAHKNTAEEYRAEKVLFVIITDGQENSSREYTAEHIRDMIRHQETHHGWEFIFLGANIDAAATARSIGISSEKAQDYLADSEGIKLNFCVMSDAIAFYRKTDTLPEGWKDNIRNDFIRRGGKHWRKGDF